MERDPPTQATTGQCVECDETDRLTTIVLSEEPIDGNAIDSTACVEACPRCYMSLTEADDYHVRELPIEYMWNGTAQNERDEAGDRRTVLNPENVDEWISVKDWVEIDLSECD